MPFRKEKTEKLLHKLAAEFIKKESGPQSLITVVKVEATNKERNVIIHLNVLPTEKGPVVFQFLSRKVNDFREFLKEKARLKTIPFIKFQLENSSPITPQNTGD